MDAPVPHRARPCAAPGCSTPSDERWHPYCSSACRSRASEIEATELSVTGALAGQAINHPCRGGGSIRKRLEIDSLIIKQGETTIIVPVATVERALAKIGHRPAGKPTNGHHR